MDTIYPQLGDQSKDGPTHLRRGTRDCLQEAWVVTTLRRKGVPTTFIIISHRGLLSPLQKVNSVMAEIFNFCWLSVIF